MRAAACLVAACATTSLGATTASADRYEATVRIEAHGGMARVGAPGAAPATAPAVGAALRLGHAWTNTTTWDLGLAGAVTQPASFRDVDTAVDGRPVTGDTSRRTIALAPQLGAELRWRRRQQPFVRLALGPQLRYQTAATIDSYPDALPAGWSLDAVVSVGVGVDLRLGRGQLLGLAVQLDHAQALGDEPPVDTLGVSLRIGRAWYPRWWSPSW